MGTQDQRNKWFTEPENLWRQRTRKKKKQRTHRTTGTIYNKDQRNSWHTGKEEQLTHIAIVRKPWSFKKYRVMASCFSTDNTSSPFGLLPGWRKGRNSSTTDMETARFILKFFFRFLSSKIPSNKLSHHCSVPPEFLHILPRLRGNSYSNVSKSCNSGIVLLRFPNS